MFYITPVNSSVPQGSVLDPLLYLLYTVDLPTSPGSIAATFANDTAVVATDSDPAATSHKLQTTLLAIQSWLRDRRIKANETKSVYVTFTTRRETCPSVHTNDVQISHENHVKYLGLHLDRRLTWHTHTHTHTHTHIFAKRKQLGPSLTKMHWLLGRKSKLFLYFPCRAPSLTRGRVCNLHCNGASSISSYIATDGLSASSSWCRASNGAHNQILISLFDSYFDFSV
jgi:hypothetical protein